MLLVLPIRTNNVKVTLKKREQVIWGFSIMKPLLSGDKSHSFQSQALVPCGAGRSPNTPSCASCVRERTCFPSPHPTVLSLPGLPPTAAACVKQALLWLLSSCRFALSSRMLEFFPIIFHTHSRELSRWKLTAQLFGVWVVFFLLNFVCITS